MGNGELDERKERSKEGDAFPKQLGQILFILGSCTSRRRKNVLGEGIAPLVFPFLSHIQQTSLEFWGMESFKTCVESFKKLARISLAAQKSTLVQYFPGTVHQSCLHLSAMLPTSESAENFVSLLAFQHIHLSVPELCFPSLLSFTFLPIPSVPWC